MKNFFKYFIILLFVYSCNYSPVYLNDKTQLDFNDLIFSGDKRVIEKIQNKIGYLRNPDSKFDILIETKLNRSIESKNKLGNPEVFNMSIEINLKITKNKIMMKEKIFNENISYNNTSSQFKLKQTEDKFENSLIRKISEDILIYLRSIEK
tara:strand:- start:561 stop:1013 length:453 start_codon:yes stop_codon:yes gene_type:complete